MMPRATSPKLSIGSILNDAPAASLPPINNLAPPSRAHTPNTPDSAFSEAAVTDRPAFALHDFKPHDFRSSPHQLSPHQPPLPQVALPQAPLAQAPRSQVHEPAAYTQYPYYEDHYGRHVGVYPYHDDGRMPVASHMAYQPAIYGYYGGAEAAYPNMYYSYPSRAEGGMRYGQKSRRFRRRYYQIHRKYKCSFEGCTKSYGSLNHLNTHIVTKQHGQRKCKSDFREEERTPASDDDKKDGDREERDVQEREGRANEAEKASDEKRKLESQSPTASTVSSLASSASYSSNCNSSMASSMVSSINSTYAGYRAPDSGSHTPKNYSLPLPPLYNSEQSAVRLPSLPSIISQCTSS